DGFEIGCDNGERVRVAFALDCCDREADHAGRSVGNRDADVAALPDELRGLKADGARRWFLVIGVGPGALGPYVRSSSGSDVGLRRLTAKQLRKYRLDSQARGA